MDLFHSCFPSSAFLWLWCALIYFIRSMMLWLQLFNLTLNRHCYKSYWYKGHLVSINCSRRCHVGRNSGTKHISRHIHADMRWHSATYLLKWHQSTAQETQATRASFWSSLTHRPTNPDTKHCVQSGDLWGWPSLRRKDSHNKGTPFFSIIHKVLNEEYSSEV